MGMLLGEILVSDGYISEENLNLALEKQKSDKRLLGIILIEMGFVTQRNLEKAIVKQKQQVIDAGKSDIASLNSSRLAEQL